MVARRRASAGTLIALTILLVFVLPAEPAPAEKPLPDPVRGRAVVRHVLEWHFEEFSCLFRYAGPRGTLADLVLETTLGSLERGQASRRTLDLMWMDSRVSCCDRIEGREEKHRALARGLRRWIAPRIGSSDEINNPVSDYNLGQCVDLVRYVIRRGEAEDREWAVETLGRVRDGEGRASARLRARVTGILAAAGESTDAASRKTVEDLMLYALQSPGSCGIDLWDEMPPAWSISVLERAHGWMLEGSNSKIVCGHRAFARNWWLERFWVPEPRQRELLRQLLDSKSPAVVKFARDKIAQLDQARGAAWLEKELEAETDDRKLIWLAGRLARTESEHKGKYIARARALLETAKEADARWRVAVDLWQATLMPDSALQHELIRLMAQLPRLVPRETTSRLGFVGVLHDLARVKPSAVAPIRNRLLREALALCPPLEECGAGETPREWPDTPVREIVATALLVLWMGAE